MRRTLLTYDPRVSHALRTMVDSGRLKAIAAALGCVLGMWPFGAPADKLYHVDGSVIEGNVLMETEDEVKVDTKYGQLIYSKVDLTKIERDMPREGVPTPAPAATPTPVNYATIIPAGPVDPFSPPVVPPIIEMIAKGETPPPEGRTSVHTTVIVRPSGTPSRQVTAPDVNAAAKSLSEELNALKAKIEAERSGRQSPVPMGSPPATLPAPGGPTPAGPSQATPPVPGTPAPMAPPPTAPPSAGTPAATAP